MATAQTAYFILEYFQMATHKSAVKRHRQSLVRRERNRTTRAGVKTEIKKAQTALTQGDQNSSRSALKAAESTLSKAARKGVIHWKTAQRKISRLAKAAAKKSK